MKARTLTILAILCLAMLGRTQESVYGASDCVGCHGDRGEGGAGPVLSPSKQSLEEFRAFVRKGSENMPAYDKETLSDSQIDAMYRELQAPPAISTKAPEKTPKASGDAYSDSTCAGCHGEHGLGGAARRIAGSTLSYDRFLKVVREGVGMMPATPADELPDERVRAIYEQMKTAVGPSAPVPVSAQLGQLLTTPNVSMFFFGVTLLAFVFAVVGLRYFIRCAGLRELKPHIKAFGRVRATAIFLQAVLVEGLSVRSLWRKDRFRWAMHGLGLYGFVGLLVADVLIQIKNPSRAELPDGDPAKLLAMIAGISVVIGVGYALFRTRRDIYFDNGITSRRDALFIHLLAHTVVSGFLTMAVNKMSVPALVTPVYLYHLLAIALLIGTAPFTRFSHVWVVPTMIGILRVTEAVARANVNLGFEREPSPGIHHKSERAAASILRTLDPNFDGEFRIRYYP